MAGQRGKSERSIQSVARSLKILRYIANNRNYAALTAISAGVGLSNSTTHGLVATLRQHGFVEQDPETGKYSLGLALFELGQTVERHMDLPSIVRPFFRQLSAKYGETLHLAVLAEGEVVYIEKIDSLHSVRMISQVGFRNPAYCTGLGKVLLAGLPAKDLEAFFKARILVRYTPATITDPGLLREHLAAIRKNGYGLDEEEIEIGLRCVAAPIKNHTGNTVAAISISIPSNRLSPDTLPQIIADMKEVAREISHRLGYQD